MLTANTANSISSSQSSSSLVEAAARHQNVLFIIYVGVLILGAVAAAVFTVLVYKAGNKYQEAVAIASQARIAEVEAAAKSDSKRIEEQGREAIAKVEAGSQERIAQAKSDADIKIAETKERTAQLEQDAATLREQNLTTENRLAEARTKLDEAERKRLELENSVAPRSFTIQVGANSNIEELKPFAGTNVVFEVLTDAEARRAANEVGNLVGFAGWKVVSVNSNPELWPGFFDGLSIATPGFPRGLPGQVDRKRLALQQRTVKAAEALALWLMERKWKASVRNNIPGAGEVPDDTIKIFIGFKPNPFFDPDWVKEIEKKYEEILREQKRRQAPQAPQPPNQD